MASVHQRDSLAYAPADLVLQKKWSGNGKDLSASVQRVQHASGLNLQTRTRRAIWWFFNKYLKNDCFNNNLHGKNGFAERSKILAGYRSEK